MKTKTLLCFIIASVGLLPGCSNNQSITIENNKSIAQQFIETWSNHDSIKVASLYAENFLYQDKAFTSTFKTKEKLISFVNGTVKGIPDLVFVPTSVIANDTMAMIEWIWKGTFTVGWLPNYPGTNKPFQIQGVTVFQIKNGLITRSTDYYDKNSFLKAVGLQYADPKLITTN
jgi:steroid delta-isomerase-like uncharacterized protein